MRGVTNWQSTDPRNRPDNPAWYGPPPIPLDPALHHTLWMRNLPEAERQGLVNEAELQREKAEADRLKAAALEEKLRLKREKAK
jgi:hypothetical protein